MTQASGATADRARNEESTKSRLFYIRLCFQSRYDNTFAVLDRKFMFALERKKKLIQKLLTI